MGTGSNTFGGTIKLEGEKEYREAISNINSDLKVFKSELKLVTSEFGANNKGAEALTAQNKILNSQITGQKNKVEEYKSALKSLTNQQVENKNKMNEVARQYDKSKEKLEAMKKSMSYTTVEIEKQEKEVKDLQDALKQSESQYNSCDKKIDTWKISLNQAQVELNKMEKELSENEKAMKDYENATKKEKKQLEEFGEILDDGQEKVNVFGDVLKANLASEAIINGIKTMTGVVKDFTVEAFNFGVEYQQSLNQIKASTNITAEEMQGLEQVMKDVYMDNFGESIDDVGNSLSVIRTQIKGLNDEDLKNITEDAIALRDTFQYEVNESIRSAKALMDHFGISGKEAYTLIAQGAQNGLDYSGEFLDNINEYSVQFKKLGFSAEDMFNIFESGTKSGAFNLDKIGDAVKEFSIRAIDGSKTTAEGFQKLGLNADEMGKKFASGGEIAKNAFFEVIQKIGAMDNKVEQSMVGVDLFGTMWEDLGPEVVTQLGSIRDGYDKTADTMKKINEVKYDDVGSALEGIKRKLIVSISEPINKDVLPIINKMANDVNWDKVGKKVSEVVGQIVGWIEKWVKKFENLNTEQVLTIAKMGAFVVAAGPVKSIVEKVTSVFGASIKTMGNFRTAINNVRTGVEKAGGQVGAFTKILGAISSPAGVVILATGAIAGLTAGTYALLEATGRQIDEDNIYYESTQKLIDKHKELTEELKNSADSRQQTIEKTEQEVASADILFEKLEELVGIENKTNAQKEIMKGLVEDLNEILPDLNLQYDDEKDKLNLSTEAIRDNISAQQDLLKAKAAQELLAPILADIAKAEIENSELVKQNEQNEEAYQKAFQNRKNIMINIQEQGGKMTKEQRKELEEAQALEETLKVAYDQSSAALQENESMLKSLNSEYDKTKGYAENLFNQAELEQKLSNLTTKAKEAGIQIPETVKTGIKENQYAVPQSIEELQRLINFDNAMQTAKITGVTIPEDMRQGILDGSVNVEEAISQLGQEMNRINEQEAAKLPEETKKAITNIAQALKDDTTVKSGGERLAGEIDTGFKSKSNGWKWGSDLVSNIADGLSNHISIGKVIRAASGVASAIKGILGHSVPEEGPLKDELTYMPDMIDNLSRTMLQASPQLKKATLSVAEMMSSNLSNLQIDTGIKKSLSNALNFNTMQGIELSKASLNTNFETSSYKNNTRNNLDIDTLTYAFKSAIKDMTGKVILDDEKMGKFVIEKVEEAIY